jgi:hypothetical protein
MSWLEDSLVRLLGSNQLRCQWTRYVQWSSLHGGKRSPWRSWPYCGMTGQTRPVSVMAAPRKRGLSGMARFASHTRRPARFRRGARDATVDCTPCARARKRRYTVTERQAVNCCGARWPRRMVASQRVRALDMSGGVATACLGRGGIAVGSSSPERRDRPRTRIWRHTHHV